MNNFNPAIHIDNSDEARQLRKDSTALTISGAGTIIFGLWGVFKMTLYSLTNMHEMSEEMSKESGTILAYVFFLIVLIICSVIDIRVRWYIGIRAMAEGRGLPLKKRRKKRKSGLENTTINHYGPYVALAVLLALVLIVSTCMNMYDFYKGDIDKVSQNSNFSWAASILVDITSLYTTIVLIKSAISIRKGAKR